MTRKFISTLNLNNIFSLFPNRLSLILVGILAFENAVSVISVDYINLESSKSQYCGYLLFPSEITLNITKNAIISSQLFQNVSKMFNNGSVILENSQCRISICGFSQDAATNTVLASAGIGSINPDYAHYASGHCVDFNYSKSPINDEPYGMGYEITSISCGCNKYPTNPSCKISNCFTRPLETSICAILYQENECHDCFYDSIVLRNNQVFKTENSAVIRSFVLRPKCTLIMTSFGKTYENGFSERFFDNSTSLLSPSYYKQGEEFTCKCPHHFQSLNLTDETESQKSIPKNATTSYFIPIIIVTILLILFVISTVYLTFVQIRSRLVVQQNTYKNVKEHTEFILNFTLAECEQGEIKVNHPYSLKFEVERKDLTLGKTIGVGTFGAVYEGILKVEKFSHNRYRVENVAVKTVHPDRQKVNLNDLKSLINEIRVMQYVGNHPNVVKFVGACTNLKKLEILSIMELCRQESLLEHLISERTDIEEASKLVIDVSKSNALGYIIHKTAFDNEISNFSINSGTCDKCVDKMAFGTDCFGEFLNTQSEFMSKIQCSCRFISTKITTKLALNLIKWSKEVAAGMEYLNEKNVLHSDLAARNILLSEDLTAKISDFGLSRKLYDRHNTASGNPEYIKRTGLDRIPYLWIAIESLEDNKYSPKSDIWGYGVILWEIFSLGRQPYAQYDLSTLLVFLKNGGRLECPEFATKEIFTTMSKCWKQNPEERPSFTELKTFFENILETMKFLETSLTL